MGCHIPDLASELFHCAIRFCGCVVRACVLGHHLFNGGHDPDGHFLNGVRFGEIGIGVIGIELHQAIVLEQQQVVDRNIDITQMTEQRIHNLLLCSQRFCP